MEQVDKYQVIVDVMAGYKWVGEIVDRHGIVVQAQFIIYIDLICCNFLWRTISFPKSSQFEDTIIYVSDSKLVSSRILFNLFKLDIAVLKTTNLFLKGNRVGLQVILLHPVCPLVLHSNCDSALRVVSNAAVDNRVECWHILALSEPTKKVIEVLKPLVGFDILVTISSERLLLCLNLHHGCVPIEFFLKDCLILLEVGH